MGKIDTTPSAKFWDMLANTFDAATRKVEPIQRKAVAKARKHLRASDLVLDYGCGTGTRTYEFASQVQAIHGIDISANMIAVAQNKAGEYNVQNIDFAQTTIFDERFKNASDPGV